MNLILKRALSAGFPVVIMYLSKKGLVSKRIVSVERFDEEWIYGFCHLRKAYRRFQRENVLAILPASMDKVKKDMK